MLMSDGKRCLGCSVYQRLRHLTQLKPEAAVTRVSGASNIVRGVRPGGVGAVCRPRR
jgi:hypothetical protein